MAEMEMEMEMEREAPWLVWGGAVYFSAVPEYRSGPDPSLFIIQRIIAAGINKYLHAAVSAPGRQR